MTMKTPDVFSDNPSFWKIGLCQVYTEPWAVEANVRRTIESLEEAGKQGAEIAITPECVFHGYGFDKPESLASRLAEIAEPLDGQNLSVIRDVARKWKMAIVVGFVEKGMGGIVHNSAAIIAPNGELLDVYRKVHCRPFENILHDGAFTPGDTFYVHPVESGGKVCQLGTMICFDREIPESVRSLRALGAEFIACPLATNTSDMGIFNNYADNEIITRCRAAENEVFIAVVNHAGTFNGGTFLVGPGGELITQMGVEPCVTVVDVPIEAIGKKFHNDPLGWMGWGYRRKEVYGKYI